LVIPTRRDFTEEIAFSTPWFDLLARSLPGSPSPFYSLRLPDYVSVVAETSDSNIILVRQYRAAVDRITTELPSGHVDAGETPEAAALRELEEETGHTADRLSLAGVLAPDTGRMGNRMWCFYAKAHKMDPAPPPEQGVEPHAYGAAQLMELIANREFDCALNLAVLFLCVARGFLKVGQLSDSEQGR
jgi:ADP-ribose pyrophosphatase